MSRPASTYRGAWRLEYHTSEGYKLSRVVRRCWRRLQPLTYVPPKRLLFARGRRELVNALSH